MGHHGTFSCDAGFQARADEAARVYTLEEEIPSRTAERCERPKPLLATRAMPSLPDVLNDPSKKPAVVADCLVLIDQEVADKGGISGMAIKAGYAAVKGIKPGFVQNVVTDLVPEFAQALDGLFVEAKEKGAAIEAHFTSNAGRVADALLAITDGKAQRSKSGVVKGTYDKLRGTAKKNVEAAVPRLSRLIQKHAG
jgi:hypothetical protein